MDKRNIIIVFPKSRKIQSIGLPNDAAETLHLPLVNIQMLKDSNLTLKEYLRMNPPHGYVLDGIVQSARDKKSLQDWSNEAGMTVCYYNPEKVPSRDLTRDFFRTISPLCFEDPALADDYYRFVDLCRTVGVEHMLVSGACSYIYWGRRSLKDLDVIVPSLEDLKELSTKTNLPIQPLKSSFAFTNYFEFSSSVEVVSDLEVLYEDDEGQQGIRFSYQEMLQDSRIVRFMGEDVRLMSPEMLVIFKFSMGRLGIDQWGKHKDDYEDARGVIVSQNINSDSLESRAKKIGALDRVLLGKKILEWHTHD